jgi:hypothetical protein
MNLQKEKWLYFRTVADEDNDDGDTASAGTSPTSLCVAASDLVGMHPVSDTSIQLNFSSVRNSRDLHADLYSVDTVVLNTDQGKTFEVMNAILQNINGGPHSSGFIVVADDMTTNYAGATVTAQYIHGSINTCGAITCAAANTSVGRLPDLGMGKAAMTAVSATTLSVNTAYTGSTATALAMELPSAAAGKAGDWITVLYATAINNGAAHTYTTTTDTAYALGSVIRSLPGADDADGTRVGRVDVSVAADNVITLTGLTDGDGGIGTYMKFVNVTGDTNGWACEVQVVHRDKGNAASTAAFS